MSGPNWFFAFIDYSFKKKKEEKYIHKKCLICLLSKLQYHRVTIGESTMNTTGVASFFLVSFDRKFAFNADSIVCTGVEVEKKASFTVKQQQQQQQRKNHLIFQRKKSAKNQESSNIKCY